ncbi:hypothetical protein PTKIN_Ptkin19aG0008600 [Pterospermum kingtungense]
MCLSRSNWNCKLAVATRMHSKMSRRDRGHQIQKQKVPKRKIQEKEMKWLEAVAAEKRSEVKRMKRAERKTKAKLRKLQRKISKTRRAIRLAATSNARIQLQIDAILHLLDD